MSFPLSHDRVPDMVRRIGDVMSTYQGAWALCGGWAVDSWIGRPTRHHGDVDIVVFQDELPLLRSHLDGWQLLAHDRDWAGSTSEQWQGEPLELPAHIHGRSPEDAAPLPADGIARTEDGFWLDIQVNERSEGDLVLNRDPGITLPLETCIRPSPWGLPALVPRVVLFYKAAGPVIRRQDSDDLRALLPHLGGEERAWLRDAIMRVGHPWLAQLSA